jgi:hypothetical protein
MLDFTTETVFNDLSKFSVIDGTQTLAAPGAPTGTGSTTGGTLAATTYYYKLTALTSKGETTAGTQSAGTTTTGTTSSVALTWTAITGATGYNIYRGTVSGTVFLLGTVATNAFTDTGALTPDAEVPPTTNTAYIITDATIYDDKALVIQRLNKYLASNAGKVYKRAATTPVKEVASISLPATGNVAGTYRLHVNVIMSGSYPIDYDRWAINKGKPFFVEVYVPTAQTGDVLAATLCAGFIKGLKKYNGQNITDIVPTYTANSGTNAGTIIISASNEYQRLIESWVSILDSTGEIYTPIATGAVTTHGVEGFGTAWFITKNLRIPTQEATRFFGEDQDERPVNGVLYNQYTFQYNAARNFTGVGAVGQTITSKTTHVFYIPSTLAATFEGYVASAFGAGSIIDAQTNLAIN